MPLGVFLKYMHQYLYQIYMYFICIEFTLLLNCNINLGKISVQHRFKNLVSEGYGRPLESIICCMHICLVYILLNIYTCSILY